MKCLCVFLVWAALGQAASKTAGLRVVVRDPSGAVIASAPVRLETAGGEELASKTDDTGTASFEALPAGKTQVSIEVDGFAPLRVNANLRPGPNRMEAKVAIEAHREEVSVNPDTRDEMTDPRGPGFTRALTPEQIAQLPDDPEELENTIKQMAGPGAVMRVDGFMGGRLPHKSQIASIRFRLTPYTAEEHDLGFTIIDIQTKPGLGAWHGSAGFAYGGDALNARNAFAPLREPQQTRRLDLSLNGPLQRNKTSTSFSLSRNWSYDSKTNIGQLLSGPFDDLVRLPLDVTHADARLVRALNRSHMLRAEYQHFSQTRSNIGNFDLPERLSSAALFEHTLRLSESGALSEGIVNDVRFQTQWIATDSNPATNGLAIIVPGAFASGGAAANAHRTAREEQLKDDISFNVKKHGFKIGLEVDAGRYHDIDLSNSNGTFTFASLGDLAIGRPLTFTQRAGNAPVNYDQYQFGGYVQDDMRLLKSFTLSAGVRWEAQTHVPGSMHFAPRLGFAWSPFRNGKTTIRGGGGIFYQWLGSDVFEETLRLNGLNQSDTVLTNPGYPDPFSAAFLAGQIPPSVVRRSPFLQMPYIERASIGLQRQFKNFMLMADTRLEHGVHSFRVRNINTPTGSIRPDPLRGNILEIESNANSTMQAFAINISSVPGKGGRRIFWLANYFLSKNVNETDSILSPPSNNLNLRADRGPSSNDARHRASALINGTLGKGFQGSTFFNASSATPYDITTGFDNNGDSAINDRPAGVPRNSARGKAQFNLGSRLSWTKGFGAPSSAGAANEVHAIRLTPGSSLADLPMPPMPGQKPSRYQVQVYGQAYNLLNHANLLAFVGVQPSPFFGQPTVALPGRRLELGAKFNF
ncbi:MAG: TonB-dependent receptor [Acidobacteriota bacterium]|nr:TonB-dependent receptor [Acidobacteriota bacterium]